MPRKIKLVQHTDEEFAKMFKDMQADQKKNGARSCLSYWFPKLQSARLPVPKTEIVHTDCELIRLCDGETPNGFSELLLKIREASERIGLPVFLRTGQTSAKHYWKTTCFLTDTSKLAQHVFELVEFSAIASFSGIDDSVWVVREYLPVKPVFTAFMDMPITREFRFFVESDKILCYHPYWPEAAFERHIPQDENWKSLLLQIGEIGVDIIPLSSMARRAGRLFDGVWSVDFLETKQGWYLIDMAPAEVSYHWPGCENSQSIST